MEQLLILPIVVFCVLSANILRVLNHIRFRLLRSRLLFSIRRPVGPVQHHCSRGHASGKLPGVLHMNVEHSKFGYRAF